MGETIGGAKLGLDGAKLGFDLVKLIIEQLEDADDDRARARIAELFELGPDAVNSLSDSQLNQMTVSLLEHHTGDADERALVTLVGSLDCDRLRSYWDRFGSQIIDNVQGREFDRLQVNLLRCGLSDVSELDDDQAVAYVAMLDRTEVRALPPETLALLIRAMFSGFTGDVEEESIAKLVEFADGETLRKLVALDGLSVEDFDDEVGGDHLDRVLAAFLAHGIAMPD